MTLVVHKNKMSYASIKFGWAIFQERFDREFWATHSVDNVLISVPSYATNPEESYYRPDPLLTVQDNVTWNRDRYAREMPFLYINGIETVFRIDMPADLRNYAVLSSVLRQIRSFIRNDAAATNYIRAKMIGLLNAEADERKTSFSVVKSNNSPFRGIRSVFSMFTTRVETVLLDSKLARASVRYFNPLVDTLDDKALLSWNKQRHYLSFFLLRYDCYTFLYMLLRVILDTDNLPDEYTSLFSKMEDTVLLAMLNFEKAYLSCLRHVFTELNSSDLPIESSKLAAQQTLEEATNLGERQVVNAFIEALSITRHRLHNLDVDRASLEPTLNITYIKQDVNPFKQEMEIHPTKVAKDQIGAAHRVYVLLYIMQDRYNNVKTRAEQNAIVDSSSKARAELQRLESEMYQRGTIVPARIVGTLNLNGVLDNYVLELKESYVAEGDNESVQLAMSSQWDLLSFAIYFLKAYFTTDLLASVNTRFEEKYIDSLTLAEEKLDALYDDMLEVADAVGDQRELKRLANDFRSNSSALEEAIVLMLSNGSRIRAHDPANIQQLAEDSRKRVIDYRKWIEVSGKLESAMTVRKGKRRLSTTTSTIQQ